MSKHLSVESLGNTVLLTIAHAPVNALPRALAQELSACIRDLDAAEQHRALVITGADDRYFCAGGDLTVFREPSPQAGLALLDAVGDVCSALLAFRGLTVAAVNGFALGGGLAIALACDVRIAGRCAELGFPETSLGLLPSMRTLQHLLSLVGAGWTRRLVLTAERVDATRAVQIGLVEQVVEAGFAKVVALSLAGRAAQAAPHAARLVKQQIAQLLAVGEGGRSDEARAWLNHEERVLGVTAFFTKKAPPWGGMRKK